MIDTLRSYGITWMFFAGLGVALAILASFIPLFDIIGYESAALFGVFYGVAVSFFRPVDKSLRGWAASLGRHELLLVAPFAILTLNALRVPNCDFLTGVGFWVAIAAMSVAVATTLGWAVHNLVPNRRLAYFVILLVVVASWAEFGLRLALEPPIVGYQWFLGYFSGSIYDEALDLPSTLLAYRRIHLLAICAVLCALETARLEGRRRRIVGAIAIALIVASGWLFATRSRLGIDLTSDDIARELGGVVESEHFIIYYPAYKPFVNDVERMVEDHEFRYAEMKEFFGTDPVAIHGKKVRSFVYPNRDVKGNLMGARRTLVAKIWLREMHILWRFYGDNMLAHELAHVFTEPFGTGPMRLSTRYLVAVNMGLVEGAATAADWDVDELDPHEASAALRKMKKAPDIEALVGASGFWTQSSGRAYTLMGSFVRYLVDTYGVAKFREAYGHGRFEEAYGKTPAVLVAEWEAFVDAIELDEDAMERARYLYDRKSIFQKVCARKVGNLRVLAGREARAGQRERARATFAQILEFDPQNVEYRLEYAKFLVSIDDREGAEKILRELLERELDGVHRAHVLSELGDLLWLDRQWEAARDKYQQCLEVGLPLGNERLLRVKSEALKKSEEERDLVREYLVADHVEDIRMFFPAEWIVRHPDEPLAHYLVGRRLWGQQEWEWALPHVRKAIDVPPGVLRDEAYHMLIQTAYFLGELDEARRLLDEWLPTTSYYEDRRREWRARILWRRRGPP